MSWRATFSRPKEATAYLTVHAMLTGRYGPEQVPPIPPCTFEVIRGDFPDVGTLTLARPPIGPAGDVMRAGDWVRIWLPGDAENDPTYLGEVVSGPWREGAGAVSLRSLKVTVSKAAWSGKVEGPFKTALTEIATRAQPVVNIGTIPDDPATMFGNPDWELLGTSFDSAMNVIENGVWGVSAGAVIDVKRPVQQVTHNFQAHQCDTPPGTWENYANCVRFPFTLPDGTTGIYPGKIPAEVTARKQEVWEQTQVPSRIATPAYTPVMPGPVTVTTTVTVKGQKVLFPVQKPAFDPAWAGPLADPAPPLKITNAPNVTPDDTKLILRGVGMTIQRASGSFSLMQPLVALDTGRPAGQSWNTLPDGNTYLIGPTTPGTVLEVRMTVPGLATTEYNAGWQPLQPGGEKRSDDLYSAVFALPAVSSPYGTAISADYEIRYTQGFLTAWAAQSSASLPGLSVNNTAILNDSGIAPGDQVGEYANVTHRAVLGSQTISLTVQIPLYGGRTSTGDYPPPWESQNSAAKLQASAIPQVTAVSVDITPPLTWFPASVVRASTQQGAFVSAQMNTGLSSQKDLVNLPEPPEGTQRWAYQGGPETTLSSLTFTGDVGRLTRLALEVVDTARLDVFTIGWLTYRTREQRNWQGWYYDLRRYPCHGQGQFPGDELEDVQRLRYNLLPGPGEKAVLGEFGTPYPSEDEDSIVNSLESVKREAQA